MLGLSPTDTDTEKSFQRLCVIHSIHKNNSTWLRVSWRRPRRPPCHSPRCCRTPRCRRSCRHWWSGGGPRGSWSGRSWSARCCTGCPQAGTETRSPQCSSGRRWRSWLSWSRCPRSRAKPRPSYGQISREITSILGSVWFREETWVRKMKTLHSLTHHSLSSRRSQKSRDIIKFSYIILVLRMLMKISYVVKTWDPITAAEACSACKLLFIVQLQ